MNRIKELRKAKKLTQTQLARLFNISQQTLSGWENGLFEPDQKTIFKIADYFGVSVDYLLGRDASAHSRTIDNAYVPDAIVPFRVIGIIKAGFDGAVEELSTGDLISIPLEMLGGRPASDYFVLQVRGNSMYPKILDGDRVLVLRADSVDSGEATIKKVVYSPGNKYVDLVPNNPEYDTRRIFENEFDQFRILGKAVKLIRDI
jgi:repressor LexA